MQPGRPRNVLVVECSPELSWYDVFREAGAEDIVIHQAEWHDISVVSYSDAGPVVSCRPARRPLPDSNQHEARTFRVDCVLMRSVSRGTWGQDDTNKLFALIHANVPAVNSLMSCFMFLEKAVVFAELRKIQARLGRDVFPLIPQTLYPSHREMIITPDMPCVVKTGSAHAGKGKMLLHNGEAFEDYASLVALQPYYCTSEPYIKWDWDGRVQVIGPHVRVFRRVTSTWKGNSGRGSVLDDVDVTPQYQLWADECARLFGGLDIFGLDFVHDPATDRLHILELNEGAIGLVHKHEREDMAHMRDLVMTKLTTLGTPAVTAAVVAPETASANAADAVAVLRQQVKRLILEKKALHEQLAEARAGKK